LAAEREAKAAIVHAARREEALPKTGSTFRTGESHIDNPLNPNQYGAHRDHGPRGAVQPVTAMSSEDIGSLTRMESGALEDALNDPVELGGLATPRVAESLQARARAEGFYPDKKEVEQALVSGKLPDPIKIKKLPWQPDMFTGPRVDPRPATPMGTVDDLRTSGSVEGVEDEWRAAQRAARVDNPEGIMSLRTPGGVVGVEDKWKAAKRAVEGSKYPEGLNAFRVDPSKKLNTVEAAPGKESERETLRTRYWDKVLELRQMIVLAVTPDEKELMQDVLDRSLANYKRDFGDFPDEKV
ncbi:MAG: hypothetical protein WAT81_05665, partial [Candidatus Moraniibacteriota bacterium]